LRQAVAKGWEDGDHLQQADGLKALRDRDDFKGTGAEWAKKNEP
jgi:hypothetical protein